MLSILLTILLAVALYFDVRTRRIPNLLTLGGVLFGFLGSGIAEGWQGLEQSGWGLLIAGMIGFFFWSARLIGGGDHKLLIAVGAFVGHPHIITTLAAVALVGGLQAMIWLLAARRKMPARSFRELSRSVRLPYSVSIALGTLVAFLLRSLGVAA